MINDQYAAGFFDGEGCVYCYKHKRWKSSQGTFDYQVRITVSNTNAEILRLLSEAYGGSVHQMYSPKGNRRACWQWTIAARKALAFMERVSPFLIIKKNEVTKAMELQKRIISHQRQYVKGYQGSVIPDGEMEIRETMMSSIRKNE